MQVHLLRISAFVLCCLSLVTPTAQADGRARGKRAALQRDTTPVAETSAAGALLEEAEQALERGDLAAAVHAFVRADQEDRNMATLVRAFEAALELDDALLIVQVAERILARPEVSDEGRRLSRQAIAKASDRLTQLELVCSDGPCSFEVDGEPASPGISYFAPGTHRVRLSEQEESAVSVRCVARSICRIALPMQEPLSALAAAPVRAPSAADSPVFAAPTEPARGTLELPAMEPVSGASRGPLAVLVLSSLAAGGLAGAAVWTGMQAVQARNEYGTVEYDADAVRKHARQTDFLIVGAAASLTAAVITSIWWVDWGARRRTDLSLTGLTGLRATHRF